MAYAESYAKAYAQADIARHEVCLYPKLAYAEAYAAYLLMTVAQKRACVCEVFPNLAYAEAYAVKCLKTVSQTQECLYELYDQLAYAEAYAAYFLNTVSLNARVRAKYLLSWLTRRLTR